MSRLVRLYPPAWRQRYGDEFIELIAQRRPSLVERVDIARGALDAWLNLQVAGPAPRAAPEAGSSGRLTAAVAIAGGGLWIGAGLVLFAAPLNQALEYKESQGGAIIVVAAMVVTALAAFAAARALPVSSRTARVASIAMLLGGLLTAMPWPVLMVGFFGYILATTVFGVIVALSRGQVVGGLLAVASLVLTSLNTEDERALLTIPIGAAWIAVGALVVRRAPASARA